jgi:hypothetical protein
LTWRERTWINVVRLKAFMNERARGFDSVPQFPRKPRHRELGKSDAEASTNLCFHSPILHISTSTSCSAIPQASNTISFKCPSCRQKRKHEYCPDGLDSGPGTSQLPLSQQSPPSNTNTTRYGNIRAPSCPCPCPCRQQYHFR